MTSGSSPGRMAAEASARGERADQPSRSRSLPQLLQELSHPPRGPQLAGDVGGQSQIALRIEPAGFDIRRQLAHGFGESHEDLFDLARFEPPFPDHARYLPA